MKSPIEIRDVTPEDMGAILSLNEEFVHFLSPLCEAELARLGGKADYFRVAVIDERVVGFLLAFVPGVNYNSLNYRWFNNRFDDFAYIDRIVVASDAQGRALGAKLYDDLVAFAATRGLSQLTCEYNIMPMNEGSAKFHKRYGFTEIGQQALSDNEKRVSLQSYRLPR